MKQQNASSEFDEFEDESLTSIIRPLLDCIASRCCAEENDSELHPVHFTYGHEPHDENIASVELSMVEGSERECLARYLRALLTKTESETAWMHFDKLASSDEDRFRSPIRFSLQTRAWGAIETLVAIRYLVAECYDYEFSREDARRQIALLTEFLSDPKNIIELSSHERQILA